MKKTITAAFFAAFMTGCAAHAHVAHTSNPNPQEVHVPQPPRHHAHQHQQHTLVRAWVWRQGHYRNNGVWVRGSWHVASVERHLLSRHPRTHVRWVEGRNHPSPPPRHYRYPRSRRR